MKMKKRFLSVLLSLVMVLGLIPGITLTAYASEEVKYYIGAWDNTAGKCLLTEQSTSTYTELTSSSTTWEDGTTYVVKGTVTIADRITVNGTVNLILCDGATLTASSGITVSSGRTLNIYGQKEGTGILSATAVKQGEGPNASYGAAIGGFGSAFSFDSSNTNSCGTINIHGGTINANKYSQNGQCKAAGIGGAGGSDNDNGGIITVYYGTVNAYGSSGAGIGISGSGGNGGTFTMYGGTVTAVAGNAFFGAICGEKGKGVAASIYGGTLTAIGGAGTGSSGYLPGDGIGIEAIWWDEASTANHGTLTAGTGVTIKGSSDNSTWNTMESPFSTRYQYMKAEGPQAKIRTNHTHSFTYDASGATITATCANTDGNCDLTTNPTLTIAAPTLTTYGEKGKSADATLTGQEAFNTATSKTIAATEIKYVGRDGTTYAESATAPTNAGKYTAKITVEGKTAKVDYEIAKAATSVTTPPTASEITYGKTLADSSLTGGTASVAGTFAWKDTTIVPAVSDSQKTEFIVVFTPTDRNYATAECKVKLTVNKAAPTVTAPTSKTLTYTGSAQELVNAGSTKDGTLYYAVTTENKAPADNLYTTTIPTETNVGTYYVWYKVKGDENHSDAAPAGPVTVTINAAGLKILCDPENGGRVELVSSGEDYVGYTAIPAEGWRFLKWTYNANVSGIGPQEFSGKDAFFMFTATDIVAHFVKGDDEIVTITFDAAGGTGTMAPVQIKKESKYTFPNSSFIPPADKAFAHWKIGEKSYAVNETITVNADLTVTAVWTEEKSEDKESKIVQNGLTYVPDELKNMFSSVKDLKDALLRAILSQGMFASEENSVFYDVVLMVRRNGGSWVPATKEDFEDGPLTVKLEYPAGTGMNTHNFTVVHMFTANTPGEVEIPAVTKKEDGIYVNLDGLSPVAISWTKIDEKAIDSLPQTGDTERPLIYGLVALVACIGVGLLIKKK